LGTLGNDLTLKLGFDIQKFAGDLSKAQTTFASFSNKLEGAVKGFFAVETLRRVGSFALEVSKLAGEAQGVKEAFDRLPNSVNVMRELKEATHGTVSELDLMKRAVMASNFDISLKALPKLLEFATLRAKQTGQSIDYLVDSIVTGIGRKSKLILDNLGISAVQLTEALGGASAASSTIGEVADAVGKIASENLEKMGVLSENASTKIERLGASWTNLKVAIGDAANSTGVLGSILDGLTDRMDILASKNLSFWEKLAAVMGGATGMTAAQIKDMTENLRDLTEEQKLNASVTRQAQQAIETFGKNIKAIGEAYKQNVNYQKIMNEVTRMLNETETKKIENIRNEKNLTEQLNNLRGEATLAVGNERKAINRQIEAIEKEIEALQKLGIEKNKIDLASGPAAKQTWFGEGPMLNPDRKQTWFGEGPMFDEEGWQKMQDRLMQVRDTAAQVGETVGSAFGDMVTGAYNFAGAMAKMAASVIDSLERIVLANMIANSSKFGLPGILLAAAGFGAVKAIFNNIGKQNRTSSYSSGRGNNLMMQPTLEARVSGRDLKFVLKNQDTFDSRVKTT
jgi:hypothetical protein